MGKTMKLKGDTSSLTDKERRFVMEYLLDYNGTRAAKEAGYAHPQVQASKLIAKPRVAAAIRANERKTIKKLELDREQILEQLYYAATRKASDFFDENGSVLPIHRMSERAQAVIDGFEVEETYDHESNRTTRRTKVKLARKLEAINLAMKHKGLFAAEEVKHEHTGKVVMDWERMYVAPSSETDPIEQRIALIGQQAAAPAKDEDVLDVPYTVKELADDLEEGEEEVFE